MNIEYGLCILISALAQLGAPRVWLLANTHSVLLYLLLPVKCVWNGFSKIPNCVCEPPAALLGLFV